ncbi:MAG: DUF4956 domain-containing protein [Bacteroidetes bacterium]|nr:DUF4956 domain-containing protein [Bacteroidota bacterium]MCH8523297.1 DUF4956 domain-containing protein [Balneolales bacterium]
MNEWLTFGDTAPIPTDLNTLLLALLLAFLSGQFIAWIYMFTHSGLSYSRSFVNSLIIIPITVTLVMLVLDNNIVTAFSLLAVFAIVRFRNILRDTLDTVYILSLIVVGLALGTQKFTTAISGVGIMSLAFVYLWFTSFGTRHRYDIIVNLEWTKSLNELTQLEALLERHASNYSKASQRTQEGRDGAFVSYRLLLRNPDMTALLIEELKGLNGVKALNTMNAEDESEI